MQTRSSLPLYVQISELLIREMSAGRILAGERLAPERDMAASMGISVGTLRKALAELTRKGLIERRHGSGNYVLQGDLAGAVYSFFRLELVDGPGLPTARVLSLDKLPKPGDLPPFGVSDMAHRIRRVRMLNERPVALEEIWLDGSYANRLDKKALLESLYLYYKTGLGLWIARVEDRLSVDAFPDWATEDFAAGGPAGFVERQGWAQDDRIAEVSRTWFDPDRARYVSRMG